ncbi:hypothetical protein [Porphyrobacter sp. YT40]|uniref:hypothetical protein n=1 Tax=Porphyrobacter sp. YT40 TaxID=2547601 RepID=UPI0011425DD0|nr:hypothetical protein [Porphyrobacter sp. YT40]QDH33575.1 hypothetical protein E2E27_04010 [Porphyrobacter sp. YT40]
MTARPPLARPLLPCLAALLCLGNTAPEPLEAETDPSKIAGLYNGNSFETYMAMQLLADGTFEWVLAVGGLDLRSQGLWEVRDGVIHLTTQPTPVPAEFRFVRLTERTIVAEDEAEGDDAYPPLPPEIVQVQVTRPSGKPFTDAETRTECANGTTIYGFVAGSSAYFDNDSVPRCDRPIAVTVELSSYDVASPRFDLAAIGWTPDRALQVEFIPNDIGVYDLTGMHGLLVDGVLELDGPLGRARFRQVPDTRDRPE